jgi:type IV pilus assembly protein PilB
VEHFKNINSPKEKLDRLHSLGLLSLDQVMISLTEHKKTSEKIEKIITSLGFITESTLLSTLSDDYGIKKISLKNSVLDTKLIHKLPKNIAESYKVIPISEKNLELTIAMSDINDIKAKDSVKRYFPNALKITPVLSTSSEILEVINKYYDFSMSIDSILKELENNTNNDQLNFSSPVVRFLDSIILDAVNRGSSDIHFNPEKIFTRIKYRIDGILNQICSFHKNYWNQILVRIKILSQIDITDSIRPHNGRFTLSILGRDVDFRVSSHPTVNGENIVIRILDKHNSLISLDELGYSKKNIEILKKSLQKKDGIMIVTGPTGSGKTTSLYSMLSLLQSESVNIMTLEDPVEYELPFIRQSSIQDIPGRGFADGLKSILRQDPDIIFVGEVRDQLTAEMAIRSAMTGHQVFTTLHTQDTIGAIFRLIDLGIAPMLLAGNISAIIAQRLIRKLCKICKKERDASKEEIRLLKPDENIKDSRLKIVKYAAEESSGYDEEEKSSESTRNNIKIYESIGCESCRFTGYKGRTCISEILEFNSEINEIIYMKKPILDIIYVAKRNGFISMRENGRDLVLRGETTIAEMTRVIDL